METKYRLFISGLILIPALAVSSCYVATKSPMEANPPETELLAEAAKKLQPVPMCAQRLQTWPGAASVTAASLLTTTNLVSRPISVLFRLNKTASDFEQRKQELLRLMGDGKALAVRESIDPADKNIVLLNFNQVPSDLVTFVAAKLKLKPFSGSTKTVEALEDINIEAARRSGIIALTKTFGVRGRGVRIAMHEVGPPQREHGDMKTAQGTYRQAGLSIGSSWIKKNPTDGSSTPCAALNRTDEVGNVCHATHVMGTLAANRTSGEAAGMAPEAIVIAGPYLKETNWHSPSWSSANVGNHSYGYACEVPGKCYSPKELEYIFRPLRNTADKAAVNGDHLAVFAAGNNRQEYTKNLFPCGSESKPYGTISGGGAAKNTLTVGSLADDAVLQISRFSDVGPTMDGRLKPEVVANGESLYSIGLAPSGNFAAARFYAMGTSMAAPVAAGAGALLQEVARSFRPEKKPLTSYGLRSALIHGACALPTNRGNTDPRNCRGADIGPTYESGFGEINALTSGCAIANVYGGLEDAIEILPRKTKTYQLVRGNEDLVSAKETPNRRVRRECFKDRNIAITMAWLDDPGETLIHDLDIQLVSPEGDIIKPWKLDPWNPSQRAIRGENTKDSVEKITLPAKRAIRGTWTLKISGEKITKPVKAALAWSGLQQL